MPLGLTAAAVVATASPDRASANVAFGIRHKDCARPVYLKECAQAFELGRGAKKMSSSSLDAWTLGDRHQFELPPERPPKKPHLRSSPRLGESPQTPPRATPTSSRPESRESSVTPSSASSRVATPTKRSSSARGKPKFPSPPGSPGEKTRRSPSPPPPPLPPPQTSSMPMAERELPLPPPPASSTLTPTSTKRRHAKGGAESPDGTESDDISSIIMAQQQTPTLRVSDKDSSCSPNGCDGSYRRTSSPTICTTPNVKPSANGPCHGSSSTVHSHLLPSKSPAKTPKRESPATIAAEEAPGWEKFLGGKISTILFTSAEVDKLRQQQQLLLHQRASKQERAPLPPPKPRAPVTAATQEPQVLLETDLSGPSPVRMATSPDNANICLPPIHAAKSSPSLNQSLLHASSSSEYKQNDVGRQPQAPWKNSLPHLLMVASPSRHDPAHCDLWKEQTASNSHAASNGVNHSHSNSDSGLSSISGRASTMSPISTMSTASSSSCGSSSSRASLRSASIVSSCTIPLDEEDEDEEENVAESDPSSPSGTVRAGSFRHIEAAAGAPTSAVAFHEEACNELLRELIEGILPSDRKLAALFGVLVNTKNSMDYMKGVFEFDPAVGRARGQKKSAASPGPRTGSTAHSKRSVSSESHSVSEMRSRFLAAAASPARTSEKEQQTKALREKKAALEERFSQKMEALRAEQGSLKEETKANEELGRQLAAQVLQLAQPNEAEKFKLHVDEIDKITSLLYGLSGRLAKAEHGLDAWPAESDADGKDQLVNKRDKLVEQMTEAKKLKENIDKRSETVAHMLRKYLPPQTFEDYVYFIQMKSRLIMEARDVQDKIALGEEQLCALRQILV